MTPQEQETFIEEIVKDDNKHGIPSAKEGYRKIFDEDEPADFKCLGQFLRKWAKPGSPELQDMFCDLTVLMGESRMRALDETLKIVSKYPFGENLEDFFGAVPVPPCVDCGSTEKEISTVRLGKIVDAAFRANGTCFNCYYEKWNSARL